MLAVAPDRLTAALDELDPGSRALLDLTIRRGIRDEDLAELLRTAPSEVARRRTDAIERVAAEVGSSRPEQLPEVRTALASLSPEGWGTRSAPAARLSSRRILVPLAAVALVLAVLVVAGAYHGGSSGPAQPALHGQAPLTAVMGGSAHGVARVSGNRLDLSVSGLRPRSNYEVWLFDSVVAAVPIAALHGPSAHVHATLRRGASAHRFLDVSLEPADGNPNHSGESVLRAPLAGLR